ncbi:glycerophosphodiester phosphodiesterase [Cellulomonas marina]|uniref:Glycerophosphoryl diester phosphodiesterase n=1 Tax=Cellulomonas marina TaxID=988821 RepID=A0A1I1AE46_9CELL|nr:glycerophosphodiester phosphodiesterase family protein [Cellulomonas marina]SFB34623.1 glycerophosphoryl diester phosphodiesterase [Cellulomonas marina]
MDPVRPARPLVVAHRGSSSVAPQNTLAALEAAWRAGADLVEVDVQRTRDGAVVVLHDDDVDATTDGTGAVADLDLAQVRALDAGAWFSPAYAGQRVPTLAEVLAFLADRPGIGLLLEVKGTWDEDAVRAVTEPVLAAGLGGRVLVQGFDEGTVAALAAVAPGLPRALLVAEVPDDLVERCRALGVVACNPGALALAARPDLVGRLQAEGWRVMVWTLDEPEDWAAAVALGVDAVITDRPDRLRGWLEGRASSSS